MTASTKLIGWVLFALVVLVLVLASGGDRGLREGSSGSYLGHPARDSAVPADQLKGLSDRIGSQRF